MHWLTKGNIFKAVNEPNLKRPVSHSSPIVVFYKKLLKNLFSNADCQKPISDS